MSSTIGDYSGREPDIFPFVKSYKHVQTGWGCFARKKLVPQEISGYALSFVGLQKLMKLKKFPIDICLASEEIRERIVQLKSGDSLAIVTNPIVIRNQAEDYFKAMELCDEPKPQHSISVFVRREADRCLLFINDSAGKNYSYHYEDVKAALNLPFGLQLFVSRVNRQITENTCCTFAVRDCRLLYKNPGCIDEIIKVNNLEGSKELQAYYLETLPASFMVDKEAMMIKAKKLIDFFVANT